MISKLILPLFVALGIVQLGVPLSSIWKYEDALKTGKLYKFRTKPVDPYDPFRGRYVALGFENTEANIREGDIIKSRSVAYVELLEDNDGFVKFGHLSKKPPKEGNYLTVKTKYRHDKKSRFDIPFNRFYMEESVAPQAESAYRKHANGRNEKKVGTFITVRVKSGLGVIEDLYIDNTPVLEFLEKNDYLK